MIGLVVPTFGVSNAAAPGTRVTAPPAVGVPLKDSVAAVVAS
jgi:hypothetical protein